MFKNKSRGFTLIELLVAISVVSFLTSIIAASTSVARAKGNDATNITQSRQAQLAFTQLLGENVAFPHPGDITKVYCVGKTTTQTCTFSSTVQNGNTTVNTALSRYFSTVKPSLPVVIDGQIYDNMVYKCGPGSDSTTCNAALYWPQSSNTPCTIGIEVLSGSGGRLCGINADGNTNTYVEVGVTSGGGACTPPNGSQNTDPVGGNYCAPISCTSPQWAVEYNRGYPSASWSCKSCPSDAPYPRLSSGTDWSNASYIMCCRRASGGVCPYQL